MKYTALLLAGLGASTMLTLPLPARADMVVTAASGIDIALGKIIAQGESLSIADGASVTLLGSDGTVLKLSGPYSGIPATKPAGKDERSLLGALSKLLASPQVSSGSLGAVRSTTMAAAARLPEPWLVSVEASGARCVRRNEAPVLWRPDSSRSQQLTVTGSARVFRGIPWPAGVDRIKVPANIFRDGSRFIVDVDGTAVELSFNVLPSDRKNPAQIASWMQDQGCIQQGIALLQSLR